MTLSVGDIVELGWLPGALYEIYDCIERFSGPPTSWVTAATGGWPPAQTFLLSLYCPPIDYGWSDYPMKQQIWSDLHVRVVCEMEVLSHYAEWSPPPFLPLWNTLFLWEWVIEPPNRYDVTKRFRHHRHRGAA